MKPYLRFSYGIGAKENNKGCISQHVFPNIFSCSSCGFYQVAWNKLQYECLQPRQVAWNMLQYERLQTVQSERFTRVLYHLALHAPPALASALAPSTSRQPVSSLVTSTMCIASLDARYRCSFESWNKYIMYCFLCILFTFWLIIFLIKCSNEETLCYLFFLLQSQYSSPHHSSFCVLCSWHLTVFEIYGVRAVT